jgi:uncharacterized protein with PhoU and TrkA domain
LRPLAGDRDHDPPSRLHHRRRDARGQADTSSPDPDFRLEAGDVLVLVGTPKQLDTAKAALEASQDAPSPV